MDQIVLFKHRRDDALKLTGDYTTLRQFFTNDAEAESAMIVPVEPVSPASTEEARSMPSRRATTVQKTSPSTAFYSPKAGEITLFYEVANAQQEMTSALLKNEGLKPWRPAVLSLRQAMTMPAAPISF